MPNSSYLDMNRDIEVLQKIIDDYEAAKTRKPIRSAIELNFPRPVAPQPVYRKPVALAS